MGNPQGPVMREMFPYHDVIIEIIEAHDNREGNMYNFVVISSWWFET